MTGTLSSRFYFPLRCNANYFDSPSHYLALKERVKQSAALYDVLIFEGDYYQATIWPETVLEARYPAQRVTPVEREQKLLGFKPVGGEERLVMTPEDGGEPFVVSGPVKRRFYSEFHSVCTELQADNYPWMQMYSIDLTEKGESLLEELTSKDKERLNQNQAQERGDYLLRSTIIKNLNRDLMVSAESNLAVSLHPAFEQILLHKKPEYPVIANAGLLSLEIVVPNFSALSWDEVLEIREMTAMKQFREKLFYIENVSKNASYDTDIRDLKLLVHQTFTRELQDELANLLPSLSQGTTNVAIDFLIGLIPVPGLSTGITAVREGTEWLKFNNSWLNAYFKLTRKSN